MTVFNSELERHGSFCVTYLNENGETVAEGPFPFPHSARDFDALPEDAQKAIGGEVLRCSLVSLKFEHAVISPGGILSEFVDELFSNWFIWIFFASGLLTYMMQPYFL